MYTDIPNEQTRAIWNFETVHNASITASERAALSNKGA